MRGSEPAQDNQNDTQSSHNRNVIQSIISTGENDFTQSPYFSWKGDIAQVLIADAAHQRGYTVEAERGLVFRVLSGDKFWIFTQNTPEASVVTSVATTDKHLTKALLSQSDIPVPAGEAFTDHSRALQYFLSRKRPQVVKPQNGSGGYGVTAGIRDEKAFSTAWQHARTYRGRTIVEDFFEGDEVRVIVLDGRVVASICRVPAYVVGDGVSSIAQLVSDKNKRRRNNPFLRIYPIKKIDQLELDGRSLDEVPAASEYVRLSTVSNVGQGGESVSVIGHLHPSIIGMAEKAYHAIPGATFLGLDVLIKDFSAQATHENVRVIEVNANPTIAMPVFPAYGPAVPTLPNDILDFVASGRYATARRADWYGTPVVAPAPVYDRCDKEETSKGGSSTQVRLLRQAASARNLQVEPLSDELTLISDGERSITFFQAIPSCTRAVTRRASNNKEWTRKLLRRANIRTPEGQVFPPGAKEQAWQFVQSLGAGTGAAVKPTSGAGGRGVSTNVLDPAEFDLAWQVACATGAKSVVVEESWPGKSYRVLMIGNAVRAVAERTPASLVGDGEHTIEQLVALKNNQRRENPYLGANLIKLTPVFLHRLATRGMSPGSVLEAGQHLQLHSAASIGAGGEARDVTADLHAGFCGIGDRVRKAMYDPFHIGIDLLAEDIALPPEEQRWAVVGVTANPAFGMHQLDAAGHSRDVAGALIEALFPAAAIAVAQTNELAV
jgi:D-alanine-D-alanine ligase-like ATP-grasp enzyme